MTTNDHFFKFNRKIVTSKAWRELTNHARAVFLAIAIHTKKGGTCFPGRNLICKLAGYHPDNLHPVRKGVKKLLSKDLIKREHIPARNHRVKCKYTFDIPEKGCFAFYDEMVHSGLWGELSDAERNLYITMRGLSGAAFPAEAEKEKYVEGETPKRHFDLCDKEKDDFLDYSGLGIRSYWNAMRGLKERGLVVKLRNNNHDDDISHAVFFRIENLNNIAFLENELVELTVYDKFYSISD